MRISPFVTASFSILFLVPLALPVGAQNASPALSSSTEDPKVAALKKEIQSNYDEMDRGTERFAIADAFKYYTKDCKFYMRDGKTASREYLRDNWQMVYRRATQAKLQTEITSISTKGDTATVATHITAQVHVKGDDGIERNVAVESHSRDFWMKIKDKWFVKQSREIDHTVTVNGQIIEE